MDINISYTFWIKKNGWYFKCFMPYEVVILHFSQARLKHVPEGWCWQHTSYFIISLSVTKILQGLNSVLFSLLHITVLQHLILPDLYYHRKWAISEKCAIHSTWNDTACSTSCTTSHLLPANILRNTITCKPKSLQMGICLGRVKDCVGKFIQSIQTLRHIQYYSEIGCFLKTKCQSGFDKCVVRKHFSDYSIISWEDHRLANSLGLLMKTFV